MAENCTPRAVSRRHTMSPGSSLKQPLSELIQQFENNALNISNNQQLSKDDSSIITPIKLETSNKENRVKVSEIIQKFKGTSTVESRDVIFKTLLDRRNEEIRQTGSFNSMNAIKEVRSMNSPVKVEFMKAWVDNVLAQGEDSPSPLQAKQFLADFGVQESEVGYEEWIDWFEAMRIAKEHGDHVLGQSPMREDNCTLPAEVKATSSVLDCKIGELDTSIDAYSIKMTPVKNTAPQNVENANLNDISFDIDDGLSFTDHMMSQYPSSSPCEELPSARGEGGRMESLDSISLHNEPIVCPVVRMSTSMRESCDSAYTDGVFNAAQGTSPVAKKVPKPCLSWFGCY